MIPARRVPRWVLPSLLSSFHFSSLVALSSLFFSFPCSWLAVHVSLAFPLVAGILFIPAVANLLLASFTDPGILHRGAEGRAGLVIQALRVKERRFKLHWCQKCQYYCPPRTFHCPWCNVCVEEFDHHCQWLNNCIGCRNFRFFFLFVAFLCGYNVVVLASCITYLVLNSHQAYGAEKICAIMVTIPAALYLLPLLILVGSQASFITLAKRPYELKLREEGRANPFDLGWARNWYAALCAPQGPKYMVRAAEPKAATRRGRKAPVARLLPQMSPEHGTSWTLIPPLPPGPAWPGEGSPGWRQGDLVAGKPREEDEHGDDRHGGWRRRRTLEIPNTQQQQSGLTHGRAPFSV